MGEPGPGSQPWLVVSEMGLSPSRRSPCVLLCSPKTISDEMNNHSSGETFTRGAGRAPGTWAAQAGTQAGGITEKREAQERARAGCPLASPSPPLSARCHQCANVLGSGHPPEASVESGPGPGVAGATGAQGGGRVRLNFQKPQMGEKLGSRACSEQNLTPGWDEPRDAGGRGALSAHSRG